MWLYFKKKYTQDDFEGATFKGFFEVSSSFDTWLNSVFPEPSGVFLVSTIKYFQSTRTKAQESNGYFAANSYSSLYLVAKSRKPLTFQMICIYRPSDF